MTNKMRVSFLGIVFLLALAVVLIQAFSAANFGWIGIISWVLVVIGAIFFILWLLAWICGW